MSVSNLNEAVVWFQKNLDFKLLNSAEISGRFKLAFIGNENFEIELFEHVESKAIPAERRLPMEDIKTCGTKHICFGVNDLSSLVERFQSNDVKIVMGPQETMGFFMCFVHGPDDILIEFIEK